MNGSKNSRSSRKKLSLLILALSLLGSIAYANFEEAIPIESLEPLEIDLETLSKLKHAPVVEL